MHGTPGSLWQSWIVAGPPHDLLAVARELEGPLGPPVLAADVATTPSGTLAVVVRLARPPPSDGVTIEHLMFDVLMAEAMVTLRVRDRRIEVHAAGNDGEALLRFYQNVRSMLAGRYDIELVRMGDARPGDAARALRSDEAELLELAFAKGYYDDPKRCGVRDLGDALGFSKSVVSRKLRTLERRALERMKTDRAASGPRAAGPERI